MLIQCTKKLVEKLKVEPVKQGEDGALFSWHANLITVNRRNTVVLVNDKSRYVVVLYGLKAKDFSRIGEHIFEGIRIAFRAEGIREEVIEKYLGSAGTISFAKTKDRTSVARLNKACEYVGWMEPKLGSFYNTEMGLSVSRYLFGEGKNSYIVPSKELFKSLKEFAGGPIFEREAAKLKVTLDLGEGLKVWRRIVVPLFKSFGNLHQIIQDAFDWENSHLHEFLIFENGDKGKPVLRLVDDVEAFEEFGLSEDGIRMKLEGEAKLSDYIPACKTLKYVYDFGDNWEHWVEVEEVLEDYDHPYPVCIGLEGSPPLEDSGGAPGYAAFLKDESGLDSTDLLRNKVLGIKELERINRMLKNR